MTDEQNADECPCCTAQMGGSDHCPTCHCEANEASNVNHLRDRARRLQRILLAASATLAEA